VVPLREVDGFVLVETKVGEAEKQLWLPDNAFTLSWRELIFGIRTSS